MISKAWMIPRSHVHMQEPEEPTGCALSDVCDVTTAKMLKREVSDGIIAPGYEPEALEILRSKRKGNYNIVQIDPGYIPDPAEHKQVYGITFEQGRNNFEISPALLSNIVTTDKNLPESAVRDLIISLITLKYTQSNSVCFAVDGQAIGVGAGQQSRIHCTRLAGSKADTWFLRQCDKVLDLPFRPDLGRPDRDNVIDGILIKMKKMSALTETGRNISPAVLNRLQMPKLQLICPL